MEADPPQPGRAPDRADGAMLGRQFESMSFHDTPAVVATRRLPAALTAVRHEPGPSAASAAIAVAISASLAAAIVLVNNHRDDTYDTDYVRLPFDSLPPAVAIVVEHYSLDHMVMCQKVVTGMGGAGVADDVRIRARSPRG